MITNKQLIQRTKHMSDRNLQS